MSSAANGLGYVFLYVSDLERSRRFYGQALGWTETMQQGEVVGFRFGGLQLVIHADNRTQGKGEYGGGVWLALEVPDVDAMHRELTGRGVTVTPVHDQHWGERMFYFSDPDGFHWSCGSQKSR
ncbi:MAG: VOC family protein [Planctomycetes bacterium]|nr:VOC family protein [Planctomycetota bacterium]